MILDDSDDEVDALTVSSAYDTASSFDVFEVQGLSRRVDEDEHSLAWSSSQSWGEEIDEIEEAGSLFTDSEEATSCASVEEKPEYSRRYAELATTPEKPRTRDPGNWYLGEDEEDTKRSFRMGIRRGKWWTRVWINNVHQKKDGAPLNKVVVEIDE